MKLWKLILLIVLFGGGAYIVYAEVTYRDALDAAHTLADSLEADLEVYREGEEELEALRRFLAVERAAYDSTVNVVLDRAEDAEEEAQRADEEVERLEERLASVLDSTQQVIADSVNAAHDEALEAERAITATVEEKFIIEHRLRVSLDSLLFATEKRLEACECLLEESVLVVDAFEDVVDRGWASRAWGSITSPRGLVTIGVLGLATYGTIKLLEGDDGYRYQTNGQGEPLGFVDVSLRAR